MQHTGKERSLSLLPILLIFPALILSLLSGCNRKPPAVATALLNKDTVSVAFYNVENLFDLHDDGTEYPEYRPGAFNWNKQTWEIKNGNIASVLAAMNPDLAGLCEVENRNTLDLLRKELEKRGAAYPYAAIADAPHRTVNCPALISRYPITGVRKFGVPGGVPNRNILEADVDLGGPALKVFVNHWPAKTHPESQRMAMAAALAGRIAALPGETVYIILGDLNADYNEWTEFRTEGLDDTKDLTGLNHVMNTVTGQGGRVSFVTKSDLCNGNVNGLHFDCWLDLPDHDRFSHSYHRLRETPDHALLPRSLLCGTALSYCDRSFTTFTWGGRLLRNGEPFGWQMEGFGREKEKYHKGEGYSDHLPIMLRLVKKPFAQATGADPAGTVAVPPGGSVEPHGFEESTEGWVPYSGSFDVVRDSLHPASGRYCLRIKGDAPVKNCTAARTVIRRSAINRSRWMRVLFDIRGSGKVEVRVRQGRGKWRYYIGENLRLSGSSRFLLMQLPAWKHAALSYTADVTSSPDLSIELRAGKDEPFCVWLDNVRVE